MQKIDEGSAFLWVCRLIFNIFDSSTFECILNIRKLNSVEQQVTSVRKTGMQHKYIHLYCAKNIKWKSCTSYLQTLFVQDNKLETDKTTKRLWNDMSKKCQIHQVSSLVIHNNSCSSPVNILTHKQIHTRTVTHAYTHKQLTEWF